MLITMNDDARTYTSAWIRWFLVAVLLMAKCYVFDVLVAQPDPLEWVSSDWLSKGAAAVIIALLVTFTRRRYPVFIVLVSSDLWMIANILYYRSYRLFITWNVMSLVGNMEGFWSSVIPYCTLSLLLFPALTLPALICCWLEAKRWCWKERLSVFLIGIMLSILGSYYRWKEVKPHSGKESFTFEWINPCKLPKSLSAPVWENERQTARYIRYHSILAYPLFMADDAIRAYTSKQTVEWSEEEQQELNRLISRQSSAVSRPQGNLLIILLESFESWLLDSYDATGRPICSSLHNYIATHDLLYVYDAETQIQYGMSADGQLIINTGLFPTTEGVTCIDYGTNVYPNLAHFYPHSAIVNPCKNVWNQRTVSAAYGYRHLIEPKGDYMFEWNDSIIMDKIMETFRELPAPCCVMGITVSGHMPFDIHPDPVAISDTVPLLFQHYLQTAHFTDRQLGRLLSWADTAAVMENATIAITGDHRIFHAWINDEIREYGQQAHLPFGTSYAGCPFILIGPKVPRRFIQQAQQVDIFTTILHAIGQDKYYWKGTGNNLLKDSVCTDEQNRIRRQISDKLIKSDYFSTFEP